MNKIIGTYSIVVLVAAIWAIKFSHHPIGWLVGLTASIPIFAAVAGAFIEPDSAG